MITAASPQPRDYISYSAVRTFQGCPLRYRFRYLDGLSEEVVSASLVFGSAIHAAVEFFSMRQLSGEPCPTRDELLKVYQDAWKQEREAEICFGKNETADSLHSLADRMLRTFLTSDLAKPRGRIIGVEEELRGELTPDLPDLLGRVDLLLETDDAVVVQDFKTSRSAWAETQADEQSEQLLLYGDLVRKLMPGKQIRLEFVVLTKTKSPKIQLLEACFDESKLDRTKLVFQNVWSAIQAGHFYPAPSPMQCGGCGYRSHCDAWRGNPT
jgi:putative RecB family exonuclease